MGQHINARSAVSGGLSYRFSERDIAMGKYDNIVKEILGQSAWDILQRNVSHGVIDAAKMLDTAQKLNPRVGGGHMSEAERRRVPT